MSAPPTRSGAIDPRIRQRREQVERSRTQKRLYRWGAVGAVLVLIALGAFLLHTPLFEAKVVTVTGAHPDVSTATIESAAGLAHHPPLISVDPGAAAARVESIPYVDTARISRHWPDGVTVAVTERRPVAVMAGAGGTWSTVDGTGRTLAVSTTHPALPLLTVDPATGPVVPAPIGGTAGRAAGPGLEVARTLPPAFAGQVVSVTVAKDGTVTLALNSNLAVQLGTVTDLEAKYEDVAAIIAHAQLRGARTIDVTVPQSPTVSS